MDRDFIAAKFERDGYTSGIPALGPVEADRIRREFDALEAREGREKTQIGLLDRHFTEPFVWELATLPAILDAVEAVLGPDLLLLATHFFCKYPTDVDRGEEFVAWHQDVTYWGLEPPLAVTAWYAVDDSDAGNGCMRVIPGSHDRLRGHGTSAREGNLLSVNQEAPVTPEEEARALDLPLRAGEFSLHHGMLVHGSHPNRSGRRRCGLTLRYVPTRVMQTDLNSHRKAWDAVLVRGRDDYGHFPTGRSPSL